MASLDLSSIFITSELLNQLYGELDIKPGTAPVHLLEGDLFDFKYRSTNQITTVKVENNQHRVLNYASAQNYYKSAKALLMSGPELADKVRRSTEPETDSWIDGKDYSTHAEAWDKIKIDVAFKANWLKFRQNKDLAHELLLTGNRQIVGRGNMSGEWGPPREAWGLITAKILMVIREDLKQQSRR